MSRTAQAARMAEHAAAHEDRAAIIGKARSHVAWALAAAIAGDLDDVTKYLERAADALGVTEPSPLYTHMAPSFARQQNEEAHRHG